MNQTQETPFLNDEAVTDLAWSVWPAARNWAFSHSRLPEYEIRDAYTDAVGDFVMQMMKGTEFKHPAAYLFQIYKRRIFRAIRRGVHIENMADSSLQETPAPEGTPDLAYEAKMREVAELEEHFLLAKVIRELGKESAFVLSRRTLGHSFARIAVDYSNTFNEAISATALRQRYHRTIVSLRNKLKSRARHS